MGTTTSIAPDVHLRETSFSNDRGVIQRTRTFVAGKFYFWVETPDIEFTSLIEHALRDLPCSHTDQGMKIRVQPNHEGYLLELPQQSEPFATRAQVVSGLITVMNKQSLHADSVQLHLHAAAASRADEAVLIVAPSGGGKTTAVTSLIATGWNYMSDEMISIGRETNLISCWPKPLSIKRSGFEQFESIVGDAAADENHNQTDAAWNIAASAVGPVFRARAKPRLIVLLNRRDSGPESIGVSGGAAVVSLVEQSMDLERFGPGGLMALAQLASVCRVIDVRRNAPETLAAIIESHWSEVIPSPPEPVGLCFASGPVSSSIEAIAIDDEIVVRNKGSGRIALLNKVGASALDRILAASTSGDMLSQSDHQFLLELKQARVLTDARHTGSR